MLKHLRFVTPDARLFIVQPFDMPDYLSGMDRVRWFPDISEYIDRAVSSWYITKGGAHDDPDDALIDGLREIMKVLDLPDEPGLDAPGIRVMTPDGRIFSMVARKAQHIRPDHKGPWTAQLVEHLPTGYRSLNHLPGQYEASQTEIYLSTLSYLLSRLRHERKDDAV